MTRGPKPIYARIRIEQLEIHIGRCEAKKDYTAVAALRYFARDSGIALNDTKIREYTKLYEAELARYK